MSQLLITPSSILDTKITVADTATDMGVHDTMRHGMRSIAFDAVEKHPMERRLAQWEVTQTTLKMGLHRRVYGLHAPLRSMLEREAIAQLPHHPALPSCNLAADILRGTDETFDFADFLNTPQNNVTDMVVDLPSAMEHKAGYRL